MRFQNRLVRAAIFVGAIEVFAMSNALSQSNEKSCDLLAGAPTDINREGTGTKFESIEVNSAIPACEGAIRSSPNVLRFRFQLARALQKAGRTIEAAQLYGPLAMSGYPTAAYNLGQLYLTGAGVTKDPKQAVAFIHRAAEAGLSTAQVQLGSFYANGSYVEKDSSLAASWFKRAAEKGDAAAANDLGVFYENGTGVQRDPKKAIELYRQSAEGGNSIAQYNLGRLYSQGLLIKRDYSEALKFFEGAAKAGNWQAQYEICAMYENGLGVERDLKIAFNKYQHYAEQGNPLAQTNLARMYASGLGVEKNLPEALKWYRTAAGNGNARAQNELGRAYQNGEGVDRDYEKALDFYRKAATQGDAIAQGNLAWMFANGLGTDQNFSEAAKWYSAAAEHGNAWSQMQLGYLYQNGKGVVQDYEKALILFRRAALQGNTYAQASIGWMYASGFGVKKDFVEAEKWLRRAADAGQGTAMTQLAYMSQHSLGAPTDELKAYIWYSLAIAAGDNAALLPLAQIVADNSIRLSDGFSKDLDRGTDLANQFVRCKPRQRLLMKLPSADRELRERLISARKKWHSNDFKSADSIISDYAIAYAAANDELLSKHINMVRKALSRQKGEAVAEAASLIEPLVKDGSTEGKLFLAKLYLDEDPVAFKKISADGRFKGVSAPNLVPFIGSAAKAAELYESASKQGSNAARINLAALSELGYGVKKDLEIAHNLYDEAAGTRFDGAAQLGLLRLSFSRLWENERSRWRQALTDEETKQPSDEINIEAKTNFVNILVADSQGRRLFSGTLTKGQQYRPPRARNDLILWLEYASSEDLSVRFASQPLILPDRKQRFGIRLNRHLLGSATQPLITESDTEHYQEFLPDETLRNSRITIEARSQSNIYFHNNDHTIGYERGSFYPSSRIRVQDVSGLILEIRPYESGDETKTSSVAIEIDGKPTLELSAPPGCLVTIPLTTEELSSSRRVQAPPENCKEWRESEKIAYVTGRGGNAIGNIQKLPDESVPGVIAGFLRINRGLASLRLQLGGQWDEALRASTIFYDQDLRQYGPNSFQTIKSALDLSALEIRFGKEESARHRLEFVLSQFKQLTNIPSDLRIEFFSEFGRLLSSIGHYAEAERFLLLAIAMQERTNQLERLPREHLLPNLFSHISEIYERLSDLDKAIMYNLEAMLIQSVDVPERSDLYNKEIGPVSLIELMVLLKRTERDSSFVKLLPYLHQEAKREIVRDLPEPLKLPLDLSVFENTFGAVDKSATLAGALGNLAQTYSWMGRYAEALPLQQQLVKTNRNIYGEISPATSAAMAQMATDERLLGSKAEALRLARQAFTSAKQYVDERGSSKQAAIAGVNALKPATVALLEALNTLRETEGESEQLAEEAFQVAQRLQSSSAASALQAFGSRLNQSDPKSRDFLRQRQDYLEELNRLDASLVSAVSNNAKFRNTQQEDSIRAKIKSVEDSLHKHDAEQPITLKKSDAVIHVQTLSFPQVRQLLRADEALINFLVTDEATFVFVASHEGLRWFRIPLNYFNVEKMVGVLRCGLDRHQWGGADGVRRCGRLTGTSPLLGVLPFNVGVAHQLYRDLFGQIENTISNKRIILSLSGPLSSLPPQVLVTDLPKESIPSTRSDYRNISWLARRHAITIIPSVGSLESLRGTSLASSVRNGDSKLYIGFGNPKLSGNPRCQSINLPKKCSQLVQRVGNQTNVRGLDSTIDLNRRYFRGLLADVDAVRQICPLPETAMEIECVSENIGSRKGTLVLGAALTETAIKKMPLDHYRIIHFATHGLLADEARTFAGADAEPALVLTPPKIPTSEDDGLLTASEIAQLKLDADWVILSACNTASGEKVDSEALSGLARAFFYAGARTLLVSHWAVESGATVLLTTGAFAALARNPSLGPAEALQRSMVAIMDDPKYAHPETWAPFVVIGEGNVTKH